MWKLRGSERPNWGQARFEHRDASNATYPTTLSNGPTGNPSELDPLGWDQKPGQACDLCDSDEQ
jgi:hypothetical protein